MYTHTHTFLVINKTQSGRSMFFSALPARDALPTVVLEHYMLLDDCSVSVCVYVNACMSSRIYVCLVLCPRGPSTVVLIHKVINKYSLNEGIGAV